MTSLALIIPSHYHCGKPCKAELTGSLLDASLKFSGTRLILIWSAQSPSSRETCPQVAAAYFTRQNCTRTSSG
jgi:hypothetical protein